MEAVSHADSDASKGLVPLVTFIHNFVPCACYEVKGQRGKRVERWLKWHRALAKDPTFEPEEIY